MRPIEPRQYLSRSALVRRGGAALVASTGVAAWLAGQAAAATPDNDLTYLRLLIGVELLATDFQAQAAQSGKLSGAAAAALKQMQADEKAHYAGLAQLVTAAGQMPATADDIDFAYPKGAFASPKIDPPAGLGDRDAARSAPTSVRSRTCRRRSSGCRSARSRRTRRSTSARSHRMLGRAGDRTRVRRRRLTIDAVSTALDVLRELTCRKQTYTASEAAAALGISLDTLRRWDKAGRIKVDARHAQPPRRRRRARSTGCAATEAGSHISARNRFHGVVTDVKTDGLMAQVEIVVNEPMRLVAVVTRDAVEELGLKPGMATTAIVKSTNVMIQS